MADEYRDKTTADSRDFRHHPWQQIQWSEKHREDTHAEGPIAMPLSSLLSDSGSWVVIRTSEHASWAGRPAVWVVIDFLAVVFVVVIIEQGGCQRGWQ